MSRLLRDPRLAFVLVLAAVLVPLIKPYTAQPASRYSFTAALWDDHSRVLDDYLVGIDRIEVDGHVYSDKAPGQPYLAVPFYALYRLVGGDPAREVHINGDLGLWWVTLWTSVVPALVLAALMWERVARLDRAHAWFAAGAMSFGSLLLPFGAELYAHLLCATLLFGAWTLLSPTARRRMPLLGGLLAGVAVASEYPSALVLLPMVAALALRREAGVLVRFGFGLVPGGVALLAYQALAFGDASTISYSSKASTFDGVPKLGHLVQILIGSRGMLIFTPVVVAGVVGLVLLVRDRGPDQIDAAVGLGCFGVLLWLQSSWGNPWGGEMPGPRYLIPALPFLAVGVARARASRPTLMTVLVAVSVGSMLFPTVASHLVPEGASTVGAQVRYLLDGEAAESLLTLVFGPAGWLVHAAVVAIAVRHAALTLQPNMRSELAEAR